MSINDTLTPARKKMKTSGQLLALPSPDAVTPHGNRQYPAHNEGAGYCLGADQRRGV